MTAPVGAASTSDASGHGMGDFWLGAKAPSLDDFETLARTTYEALDPGFKALTGDIIIRVADFATNEVLDEMGIADPFDLLGLFQGIGLAQGPATAYTGQMPNQVWLYRRPILDYWAGHDESLADIVAHVLIHEIGHHFGYSDEDMDAIERAE